MKLIPTSLNFQWSFIISFKLILSKFKPMSFIDGDLISAELGPVNMKLMVGIKG